MNAISATTLTAEQVAAFRASADASGSDDLVWLAGQVEAGDRTAEALVCEAVAVAAAALRDLASKAASYRQAQRLKKLLANAGP